jgi:hypothetical protein
MRKIICAYCGQEVRIASMDDEVIKVIPCRCIKKTIDPKAYSDYIAWKTELDRIFNNIINRLKGDK